MSHKKPPSPSLVQRAEQLDAALRRSEHPPFIAGGALSLAQRDPALFELMEQFLDAGEHEQREQVVAELTEALEHKPDVIDFEEFARVEEGVLAFKRRLRETLDAHGGVSEVARLAGIPQPSLSRMLSSPSMPRKTTLLRIARALGQKV